MRGCKCGCRSARVFSLPKGVAHGLVLVRVNGPRDLAPRYAVG
jgi:hypothetical protein